LWKEETEKETSEKQAKQASKRNKRQKKRQRTKERKAALRQQQKSGDHRLANSKVSSSSSSDEGDIDSMQKHVSDESETEASVKELSIRERPGESPPNQKSNLKSFNCWQSIAC